MIPTMCCHCALWADDLKKRLSKKHQFALYLSEDYRCQTLWQFREATEQDKKPLSTGNTLSSDSDEADSVLEVSERNSMSSHRDSLSLLSNENMPPASAQDSFSSD